MPRCLTSVANCANLNSMQTPWITSEDYAGHTDQPDDIVDRLVAAGLTPQNVIDLYATLADRAKSISDLMIYGGSYYSHIDDPVHGCGITVTDADREQYYIVATDEFLRPAHTDHDRSIELCNEKKTREEKIKLELRIARLKKEQEDNAIRASWREKADLIEYERLKAKFEVNK